MKKNVIEPIAAEGMGTATQEGDITMDKVYTFRRLNSTDSFLMFKIIGKIGVNEVTECFNNDAVKKAMLKFTTGKGGDEGITLVGISVILEMANVIMNNLSKCEAEVYQMLSQTSNLSVKQIKELDFAIFMEMVIDFIKKEEFKDFVKVVSTLFKPVK